MVGSHVQAGPASQLASETRRIVFSASLLASINAFLDELVLSSLVQLWDTSSSGNQGGYAPASRRAQAPRLSLPLTTRAFKAALLAYVTQHGYAGTSALPLFRDAVLEAELVRREWAKTRGKSDTAYGRSGSSSSSSSLLLINAALEDEVQTRPLEAVFREVQTALNQLSPLGARANHPYSTASKAAAASQLAVRGVIKDVSPLFVLYISSITHFLAVYLVKNCARMVERDPSTSNAGLSVLSDLMAEDAALTDLWNGMHVKALVERELAASQPSLGVAGASRPGTASSVTRSAQAGPSSPLSNSFSFPAVSAPTRRLSLRGTRSSSSAMIGRGISSSDVQKRPSTASSINKIRKAQPEVPVSLIPIPYKPTTPTSGDGAAAMQSQLARGSFSRSSGSSSSSSRLPASTLAFLEFSEEGNSNGWVSHRPSLGARPDTAASTKSRLSLSTNSNPDAFESLLAQGTTVKMSLTPSRFRLVGTGASASSGDGAPSRTESLRSHAASAPPAPFASTVPGSSEDMGFTMPQRTGRLQARSARPSKGREDDEADEEQLDDDELELYGAPKRKAKKESLFDILSSEPPWEPSGPSSSGKAAKLIGNSDGLPPEPKPSAPPAARKFSPIANLDLVSNANGNANEQEVLSHNMLAVSTSSSERPGTSGSLARPTTGNSYMSKASSFNSLGVGAEAAFSSFPVPPAREAPPKLTSYKSVPDLSSVREARMDEFPPMPRRKLMAKDERAARTERFDDLVAFLRDAPPPPAASPAVPFALSELPTPSTSSSGSSKSRLGSSKLRSFLTGSSSARRPSLPANLGSEPFFPPSHDDLARLPKSVSRKLSKNSGFVKHVRSRTRTRSGSISLKAPEAASPQPDAANPVSRSSSRDEYDFSTAYRGMQAFAEQEPAPAPASIPGSSRNMPRASPVLRQQAFSAPPPALPAEAPLMTPENSNKDLYAASGLPSAAGYASETQPRALDTPPATPHDKQQHARFVPLVSVVEEAAPLTITQAQAQAERRNKHERRVSYIKRKAVPRAEDASQEVDVEQLAPLSPSSAVSRDRPRNGSQDSGNVSFMSIHSSNSVPEVLEEEEVDPEPVTAREEQPDSEAGSILEKETHTETQVQKLLMRLRTAIEASSSVDECLDIVSAALTEETYDIRDSLAADSESSIGMGKPVFWSSPTVNRASTALLEHLLQPENAHLLPSRHAAGKAHSERSGSEHTPSLGYSSAETAESVTSGENEDDELKTPTGAPRVVVHSLEDEVEVLQHRAQKV